MTISVRRTAKVGVLVGGPYDGRQVAVDAGIHSWVVVGKHWYIRASSTDIYGPTAEYHIRGER